MRFWPFLAQTPVALRANTVRPYGYAFANELHGRVRVPRPAEKVKCDMKVAQHAKR